MPYIVLMFLSAQFAHANSTPVIISEIGAQEASDYEWVEIYNQSDAIVDMTDWKFYEENTKHGLKASQGDLIINSKEYAIIANVPAKFLEHHPGFNGTIIDSSWSSLKETGELIGLVDGAGNHLDEFTYSTVTGTAIQRILPDGNNGIEWVAHLTGDSAGQENEFYAPVAENNTEITEIINDATDTTDTVIDDTSTVLNENQSTDKSSTADNSDTVQTTDQSGDATVTEETVIASENLTEIETESLNTQLVVNNSSTSTQATSSSGGSSSSTAVKQAKVVKKKILPAFQLSEIFPNPYGSDAIYEFFEIENVSDKIQSLNSWELKTLIQTYTFGDIKVPPHSFYQLLRAESGIAFNNHKETVQLIDPANKVADKMKYTADVPEDASYIRLGDAWKLSIVPTRGGINIYVPINIAPEITAKCVKGANDQNLLVCDASDTTDPDHDQLSFRWNMRNKDDQILYYWEDDYFEEPYETFKSGTLELIVSDAKHKVSKSVSIPRRGETIVNIQGVKNIVPQTEIKKTVKKKAAKKSAVKKAPKAKTFAKTYFSTAQGLVIDPPDKDHKKMTIEFPGLIVSSPRGRLPDVNIGDEVSVRGTLNPTSRQITISVAEDVSVIFHHAPPQPITVASLDELKDYSYALVSIAGQAQDIYDTGFKLINDDLQVPVYLPPTLHTSPDRFADQEITVAGIVKEYRNAPELVPRDVDDIKIKIAAIPEIRHKTVNQFINVWRDWRVGTTLAIAALMTLLSWRIRRLVPAAVRVDATAEEKGTYTIVPKNRAVGGRPPSIMLE